MTNNIIHVPDPGYHQREHSEFFENKIIIEFVKAMQL